LTLSQLEKSLSSSKIDRLAAISTSKFKWPWWAQFLSHTLQISEINLSFEAVKLILLYLINISFSFLNKIKLIRVMAKETDGSWLP
jgi:hypothetical protein